jgi:hypothetical protein
MGTRVTLQRTAFPTRGPLNATILDLGKANFSQPDLLSFVTLGDSRTAYNGSVTVANPGETAVYTSDRGYVSWAMVMLRKRMKWLKNGGVGGDTVAQMLARTDALLALNPGWLFGFGHINSVSANVSAGSIITDLTAIFDKCAARVSASYGEPTGLTPPRAKRSGPWPTP